MLKVFKINLETSRKIDPYDKASFFIMLFKNHPYIIYFLMKALFSRGDCSVECINKHSFTGKKDFGENFTSLNPHHISVLCIRAILRF